MATLLIRNLDPSVRDALRTLARHHGRSMEAEVREILAREVKVNGTIDWSQVPTVHTGRSGPITREQVNGSYEDL
jgi:plasmid stability protein